MSESKPEPAPAEVAAIEREIAAIAALERLVEHYHHVAAHVAAGQALDAHRMHLAWCGIKGFLIAVVGIPALMLLLLLFLARAG